MTKREVTVEGKTYQIEFDYSKLKVPFTAKINDRTVEVALENEPKNQTPFVLKVRGKKYEVELSRESGQASFTAKVNNVPIKVELKTVVKQTIAIPSSTATSLVQRTTRKTLNLGAVTAPMSGKIIKVKVKKGDSVKIGDVLCTLEAMKMENEITAPKTGTVEEVLVQEGKTVNTDDVLVIIK